VEEKKRALTRTIRTPSSDFIGAAKKEAEESAAKLRTARAAARAAKAAKAAKKFHNPQVVDLPLRAQLRAALDLRLGRGQAVEEKSLAMDAQTCL
jgi:hypothetical protein